MRIFDRTQLAPKCGGEVRRRNHGRSQCVFKQDPRSNQSFWQLQMMIRAGMDKRNLLSLEPTRLLCNSQS